MSSDVISFEYYAVCILDRIDALFLTVWHEIPLRISIYLAFENLLRKTDKIFKYFTSHTHCPVVTQLGL